MEQKLEMNSSDNNERGLIPVQRKSRLVIVPSTKPIDVSSIEMDPEVALIEKSIQPIDDPFVIYKQIDQIWNPLPASFMIFLIETLWDTIDKSTQRNMLQIFKNIRMAPNTSFDIETQWDPLPRTPCDCKERGIAKHVTGGKYLCKHYNLLVIYPKLCLEWDYDQNDDKRPQHYLPYSRAPVKWICPISPCDDHKYEATITNRTTNKMQCGFCFSRKICDHNNLKYYLEHNNPVLLAQWHPTFNNLGPEKYFPKADVRVWWTCTNSTCGHHVFDALISNRTSQNTGCPFCVGQRVCNCNCLATIRPDLAEQWHPTLNLLPPTEFAEHSSEKIWWICSDNWCGCHVWEARINDRTSKNSQCPHCLNRKICDHNNLKYYLQHNNPDLLTQWHPTLNKIPIEQYPPRVNEKVWWICPKNPCGCHIYDMRISDRTIKGCNCPFCANLRKCEHNNLLKRFHEKCKEWDKQENKLDPDQYAPFSHEKVHWICPKNPDHKYSAKISNRTGIRQSGCPVCCESKGEKLIKLILTEIGIVFQSQYRLRQLPTKRYDFYFKYENKEYILEFDGIQHFKEFEHFHRDGRTSFNYRREIDIIKTLIPSYNGIKLIRIDYSNVDYNLMKTHLLNGIKCDQLVYFSDPKLYEWLVNSKFDMDILKVEAPLFYEETFGKHGVPKCKIEEL